MPKVSQQHCDDRKEEIIEACRQLYESNSYQDITIKMISEKTSISRPSIYNYFETKEEIFLDILKKEYAAWGDDLKKLKEDPSIKTQEDLIKNFAQVLGKRELLLKIQAMNLYDIEEHSRKEHLVEYKIVFGQTIIDLYACLEKFFPELDKKRREYFRYTFVPFMYGIYPFVNPTKKQVDAANKVGIHLKDRTIETVTYDFMKVFFHLEDQN